MNKSKIRRRLLMERRALIKKLVMHERKLALFEGDLPAECESVELYPKELNRVLTEAGAACAQLAHVEQAIEMIDEGTYGLCERCGKQLATNKEGICPVLICRECQEARGEAICPVLAPQRDPGESAGATLIRRGGEPGRPGEEDQRESYNL